MAIWDEPERLQGECRCVLLPHDLTLTSYQTSIREIDDILVSMTEVNPAIRVSAYDALKSLAKVVSSMPPDSLNIAPIVIDAPITNA